MYIQNALIKVPRFDGHDGYMDDYDWFCYFPSRNFKGTTNPTFDYPYIGKNMWESQLSGEYWMAPPTKQGNFSMINTYLVD